jgi:very-short-patch-repair endonuclease
MPDDKSPDQPTPHLLQPHPPAGGPPRPRSPKGDAGRGDGGEESGNRGTPYLFLVIFPMKRRARICLTPNPSPRVGLRPPGERGTVEFGLRKRKVQVVKANGFDQRGHLGRAAIGSSMNEEESQEQPNHDLLQPHPSAGGPPRPRSPKGDAGRGAMQTSPGGEESADRRRKPPGPPTVRLVASRDKVLFARQQRQLATRMEARLWTLLRNHRFGFKFRRQHPWGDFVLDFFCSEARLCVEIDGPTHDKQRPYDEWRDEELARGGVMTIRLQVGELAASLPEIAETIRRTCAERSVPHP